MLEFAKNDMDTWARREHYIYYTEKLKIEFNMIANRNLPIDFPPILIFSRNFRCQMPNPYVLPLFLPLPAETRANSLLPDYHIQQLR